MGIVLLGYRGSGKTSVGRLLAARLGWRLLDTDDLIVAAAAGRSIREIFADEAERGFRLREEAAVREALTGDDDLILSLGGGAPTWPATRALLVASKHRRVYLRCRPDVLHERIAADPLTAAQRPALSKLGGGLAEIESMLAIREPLYRETMTEELDVSDLAPEEVVARLL